MRSFIKSAGRLKMELLGGLGRQIKIGDIPASRIAHTKEGKYAFNLLLVFVPTGLRPARRALRWSPTAH
jgi:hypothetical protein